MVRQMHTSGDHTISAIAAAFNITRPTVYRALESPDTSSDAAASA